MAYPQQRNFSSGRSPGQYSHPPVPSCDKRMDLINAMRLVWEQHVYWTRMAIISIIEKRADEMDTVNRLLQNPNDLARLFSRYYSKDVTTLIAKLVTEHLQLAAELLKAMRAGKNAEAEALNRRWYENADQMADAFAKINPHYDREMVRKMFYNHLDITLQEAARRFEGNYPADITAFDKAEKEILEMADMFATGIMRQFPRDF